MDYIDDRFSLIGHAETDFFLYRKCRMYMKIHNDFDLQFHFISCNCTWLGVLDPYFLGFTDTVRVQLGACRLYCLSILLFNKLTTAPDESVLLLITIFFS